MDQQLISVIIPVYKVEPYLDKCVQSVLAQTYPNIEILLVDDGSPDKCPAMCDKLAAENSRVRVIHQPNSGQGSARNRGLDVANGSYIGFVDSDDYIAPDMYEKLYTKMVSAEADICICDCACVDLDGTVVREMSSLSSEVIGWRAALEHLEYTPNWWRFVSPVNKIYKRCLFDEIRFPENRRYEDEFVVYRLFYLCQQLAIIPDVLYYCVQRPDSSTRTQVNVTNLDEVDAHLERYEWYRSNNLKSLKKGAVQKAYESIWQIIGRINVWKYRDEIWPRIRSIMVAKGRQCSYRSIVLGARYVWALAKWAFMEQRG